MWYSTFTPAGRGNDNCFAAQGGETDLQVSLVVLTCNEDGHRQRPELSTPGKPVDTLTSCVLLRSMGSTDYNLLFKLQHLDPGPIWLNQVGGNQEPLTWPRWAPENYQPGLNESQPLCGKRKEYGKRALSQECMAGLLEGECVSLMSSACTLRGQRESSEHPACWASKGKEEASWAEEFCTGPCSLWAVRGCHWATRTVWPWTLVMLCKLPLMKVRPWSIKT